MHTCLCCIHDKVVSLNPADSNKMSTGCYIHNIAISRLFEYADTTKMCIGSPDTTLLCFCWSCVIIFGCLNQYIQYFYLFI